MAKIKRRIDVGDKFGSIGVEEAHSRSGSEDKRVLVGQVEVIPTPEPDRASLAKSKVEEEVEGTREEEASLERSDTMPSTTRPKYSRFKGDGSQDVDDWRTEFKSTYSSTKTQLNPSTALKRPKHHQNDQSIVPGILGSSLPQEANVHTSHLLKNFQSMTQTGSLYLIGSGL